ncbi:MAG TPA: hypothetical protein VE935_23850 [Burkholderiales bacterium]|jgi:hypothetical protein|nr:hypothetical protein [Burkholderiales bacterium]
MVPLLFLVAPPAWPLSRDAEEFMRITKELEPVQCEKRRLRREIALAEAEQRAQDASALRARFAALDREPKTAKLERRLGVLEKRLVRSSDPEDLESISRQQREAFYRCE